MAYLQMHLNTLKRSLILSARRLPTNVSANAPRMTVPVRAPAVMSTHVVLRARPWSIPPRLVL